MHFIQRTGVLAAVAIVGLTVSTAQAALVGHWKVDEGQGTTTADETSNNNDGTLRPADSGGMGPAWLTDASELPPVPSGTSAALEYDGSEDFVDMSDADVFSINEPGDESTIAVWIYPEANAGGQHMFSKTNEWGLRLLKGTNGPRPRYDLFGGNSGDPGADAELPLNEWSHVAVSWTAGSGGTIYVDGEPVHTSSEANTSPNDGSALTFGAKFANQGGFNAFFDGRLDEHRLYDEALSQSEIQAIAVPEPASLAMGLVGCGLLAVRRRRRRV